MSDVCFGEFLCVRTLRDVYCKELASHQREFLDISVRLRKDYIVYRLFFISDDRDYLSSCYRASKLKQPHHTLKKQKLNCLL